MLGLGLRLLGGVRRGPTGRSRGEEELEAVKLGKKVLFLGVEGTSDLLLLLSGVGGGLSRVRGIHVSGRLWRRAGRG